jgi:hypothetical protein
VLALVLVTVLDTPCTSSYSRPCTYPNPVPVLEQHGRRAST